MSYCYEEGLLTSMTCCVNMCECLRRVCVRACISGLNQRDAYFDVASCFLTRFNKIAIQGTTQMAVDKEAISLSINQSIKTFIPHIDNQLITIDNHVIVHASISRPCVYTFTYISQN